MIGSLDLNAILAVLLGAGGILSAKSLRDVVVYFRAGKQAKETSLVASLTAALKRSDATIAELESDLAFRTDERDYWRNRSGSHEYLLDKGGIAYDPPRPLIKRSRDE